MDKDLIHRRWLYSHDEGGAKVFRPAEEDFPPSRVPRIGYSFEPDGRVTRHAPGPADRTEAQGGRWHLDVAGKLVLEFPGRPAEEVAVQGLTSDRLILK